MNSDKSNNSFNSEEDLTAQAETRPKPGRNHTTQNTEQSPYLQCKFWLLQIAAELREQHLTTTPGHWSPVAALQHDYAYRL